MKKWKTKKVETLMIKAYGLPCSAEPASVAPSSCRKGQEEDLTKQHQQLLALPQLDGNTCAVALVGSGLERLTLLPCQ